MTELTHGFEPIRDERVAEINARATLWRHAQTGAQLLSLENDDENKVFGINFRTPPSDSTGLPHILEHVVLAGSEKYPLKDPFFELVKGSLATFVNAMTMPDKTVYPAASTNLQDFYNLLEVYADAVFHPLLSPEKLAQEGWHYELETADAPLTYKGVVFNEMKGAYSSPDNLLGRYSQQALFPDNTYGFDSGGDPTVIPNLTYGQFRTFYETYYHPSNALIFFYGDDDLNERLRRMDGYLSAFQPIEVDGSVALQKPFAAPRTARFTYGVDEASENGAADDHAPKSFVEINWLLPEQDDIALVMALQLLAHALLDTPASPLRKTLIDSGLGEDVLGGLATHTRQMAFSAGLKGVAGADVPQVEPLIRRTLGTLAEEGIDPEMIAASLNTIEFALRENNTGRFPRGLALMMRSLGQWANGGDPLAPLAYEAPLAAVRARLAAEPDYLQTLIGRYLLDNPHRVTVILEPEAGLNGRLEAAERARLDEARAGMSAADAQTVLDETRILRERQNAPDTPEALASLPMLRRADLEPRHKPIPIAVAESHGARVISHDLFTNGIVYLDLGLDLSALPSHLLPYAGIMGQALLEMGTQAEDFVRLSQRIGRTTGGIRPDLLIAPVVEQTADDRPQTTKHDSRSSVVRGPSSVVSYLILRGKATTAQAPELLAILRDVLLTGRLDDRERFRQIVLEAKAGAEASLAPAGHQVTNTRLRAHLHPAYRVEETVDGVEQLLFLRRLTERIESDWPGVLAELEETRRLLVGRGLIANVTLDEGNYRGFAPRLDDFLREVSVGPQGSRGAGEQGSVLSPLHPRPPAPLPSSPLPRHEGLSFPAQVNYVGKGANLYDLGYTLHGSIAAINNLLRTGYLLQKIRIQGGAYGAFATFSVAAGAFTYLSYRDPNLSNTLAVYDATADYLRGLELDEDEITRAVIGAIGAIDAYQLPDAKGYTSLTRYLTGETDARLQQFRDELLGATLADFHALAGVLERVNEVGDVVVLGSGEALEKAGVGLEITKVM